MFTPEERERVYKTLLRAGVAKSEDEIQVTVDNVLALATELHKVWVRNTSRAQKSSSPQRTEGGMGRSPPQQ